MKLDKTMIGKYVMRTGPCKIGKRKDLFTGEEEEIEDYSYIGEKIKLLSLDNNIIRYSTKDYKNSVLDSRWNDDNWALYDGDKYEEIEF